MASPAAQSLSVIETFGEKQFYLDEFRGRTLLFFIPAPELRHESDYALLADVVRELLTNDTRVVVLAGTAERDGSEQVLRRLQRRLGPLIFREETIPLFPQKRARTAAFLQLDVAAVDAPAATTTLLATIWGTLRRGPLFVGIVGGAAPAAAVHFAEQVATRLRVHKLVLVESAGGITGADGKQLSFLNEAMLTALLAAGQAEWAGLAARRPALEAVRAALLGGVASVNVCAFAGLARELFTYEGAGTLCTLQDYCTVQHLGVDDYEEVERLIERGQREGLLKPRTSDEVAGMLVNGYGATIGAHHLAGICALTTEPYAAARAGEVVALYTITRFKGEGVGARLLARVVADARLARLAYVFACTIEERAQAFFERQGFRRVRPEDVPAAKWAGYEPQRRAQVAVFRLDL